MLSSHTPSSESRHGKNKSLGSLAEAFTLPFRTGAGNKNYGAGNKNYGAGNKNYGAGNKKGGKPLLLAAITLRKQ